VTHLPEAFYQRAIDHFREVQNYSYVLRDSIPVPFFGDVGAYLDSDIRIVTVGLNPSWLEFFKKLKEGEQGPPPRARRFDVEAGLASAAGLESTLSNYFKHDPYTTWFSSFENVLSGMGASFYPNENSSGKEARIALHIDVCSPIATTPTWSHLEAEKQSKLTPAGRSIFLDLLHKLEPDILIASVAHKHVAPTLDVFRDRNEWSDHLTITHTMGGVPRKLPCITQSCWQEWEGRRRMLVCWGSAANTPFGKFSNEDKAKAGHVFLKRWQDERVIA
jgi:hypothetical protein